MTLRETIENEMKKNGYIEITNGVYLHERECLQANQKDWDEEDPAKNFDFSQYDFWITTDHGKELMGFETYDEALADFFK